MGIYSSAGPDVASSGGPGHHGRTAGAGPPYPGPGPDVVGGADPATHQSFAVHLDSLRAFGRELQAQIDAIQRSVVELSDPAHAAVSFGDFPEANSLAQRHADALADMVDLLAKVRAAVSFADRVTDTVADCYEQADHQAAGGFGRTVRV